MVSSENHLIASDVRNRPVIDEQELSLFDLFYLFVKS